jgi:aminoglycoside N3'-acetyltransferase
VINALKQRLMPGGARRTWNRWRNRLLRRVTVRRLVADLRRLGLAEGDVVCVHSSLNAVGYLVRGPDTVIDALRAVVGERGTVMMPTFTTGDNTYRYVTSGPPPFDPRQAPCETGTLPERFWRRPGVRRSLHPTHSVAALGPLAEELLRDHEKSETPFGDGTPYAGLLRHGGKVLLLQTNGNSVLHRMEEEMGWPHLFRDERYELQVQTPDGVRIVRTAVHERGIYHKVVLPGLDQGELRLIHMPWYALQFMVPESEQAELARLRPDVAAELAGRLAWFEREGIARIGPVGYGQAALLDARRFCDRIADDLRAQLSAHGERYEPARLEALGKARSPH